MITDDPFFYLPNLYTFQNGNGFYGSFRGLRFHIVPEANETEAGRKLEADVKEIFSCVVWYGEFCLEESEVVDSAAFPLDEEGYQAVLRWLEEQYVLMLSRERA